MCTLLLHLSFQVHRFGRVSQPEIRCEHSPPIVARFSALQGSCTCLYVVKCFGVHELSTAKQSAASTPYVSITTSQHQSVRFLCCNGALEICACSESGARGAGRITQEIFHGVCHRSALGCGGTDITMLAGICAHPRAASASMSSIIHETHLLDSPSR